MDELERDVNLALMQAVSGIDLGAVQRCLAAGADPNYTVAGEQYEPDDPAQPTSPLRLLMFRISDCDLGDAELKTFAEIAAVLLRHGADPAPALRLAEARYGPFPAGAPPSALLEVWRVLRDAQG